MTFKKEMSSFKRHYLKQKGPTKKKRKKPTKI